ncbi:MAG: tyrosine-type recombinase/integrase [Gallionella sp.]
MGGVNEHRGKIQVTFYWNGKRYRPTLGIPATPTNIKYAARLKAEIERHIALGQYSLEQFAAHFPTSSVARQAFRQQKTKPTFRDVSILWLQSANHLSPGTLIKYNQWLNFWLESIGDAPIDEIKFSTLAALINSKGWKAKNRNDILIPLRKVMEMAFLDGLIETNPTDRIKNAKVQKEPPDPLTYEEVVAILTYMREHNPQVADTFEFAFFTGMRPSELIALRWVDIDHEQGLARVKRARTFGEEHETKTFKVRDVEMGERAVKALQRQKSRTFLKSVYVFENPVTGAPFHSERPLRETYWNPALKALGIRPRFFYQTRHTYATLNLMIGANPMWVSKQLGHANMTMLMTVYSKWINGADKSSERRKIDLLNANTATRLPPNVIDTA